MSTNNLSISVIILVCDRKHCLNRAVKSVLNQSVAAAEILIVDNGLSSASDDWKGNPMVNVYRTVPRLGIGQALNFGVSVSTGEFCLFLEDDDYWPLDYIENILICLKSNKNCFTVAEIKNKDSEGKLVTYKKVPSDLVKRDLLTENPGINISNIGIMRSDIDRVLGFDIGSTISVDKIMAARLIENNVQPVIADGAYNVVSLSGDKMSRNNLRSIQSSIGFFWIFKSDYSFQDYIRLFAKILKLLIVKK